MMDYEKAYKAVLQTATQWIKDGCTDKERICLECVFPELRESEDERMMREFNDWLCEEIECRTNDLRDEKDRRTLNMLCYVLTKVKEWLEKQKEPKEYHPLEDYSRGYNAGYYHGITDSKQKLAEKQDYSGLNDFERAIHRGFLCAGVENVPVTIIKETAQECMAKIKPVEWSEEDEKNMATLFEILNCYQRLYDGGVIVSAVNRMEFLARMTELSNWLKSIRPSWKPSEEQMEALERICSNLHLRASDDAPKLDEIIKLLKRK